MEAIGERPEYYSGNVVVLGRAGVATPAAPSGFNVPMAGSSGALPGSYAYDDGSRLSPGWRLQAVPEPTQAGSEPAEPLGLAELGRLVAQAAAAAPSILAGASYVEAANYAADVEDLSRTVEYLQVLSAGTVGVSDCLCRRDVASGVIGESLWL